MLTKALKLIVSILLCQSLVIMPLVHAEQLSLPSGDLIAPVVTHEAVTDTSEPGATQQIKATVTDNVGVQSVTLFYRTIGANSYKRVIMNRSGNTDQYTATLGPDEVVEPGVEYYIQAMDLAGNSLLHGYSFSPLVMNVGPSTPVATDSDEPATIASTAPESEQANAMEKERVEEVGKSSGLSTKTWIWIGVGVLAAGAIAVAAGGSGGGDDEPAKPAATTLTIEAPTPGQ